MFECDRCGECCRHLDRSDVYAEMDRGDGICRYLAGDLCSIYETRPLICRVDECYEAYFSDTYTIDEYYRLNKLSCDIIKGMKRR